MTKNFVNNSQLLKEDLHPLSQYSFFQVCYNKFRCPQSRNMVGSAE